MIPISSILLCDVTNVGWNDRYGARIDLAQLSNHQAIEPQTQISDQANYYSLPRAADIANLQTCELQGTLPELNGFDHNC